MGQVRIAHGPSFTYPHLFFDWLNAACPADPKKGDRKLFVHGNGGRDSRYAVHLLPEIIKKELEYTEHAGARLPSFSIVECGFNDLENSKGDHSGAHQVSLESIRHATEVIAEKVLLLNHAHAHDEATRERVAAHPVTLVNLEADLAYKNLHLPVLDAFPECVTVLSYIDALSDIGRRADHSANRSKSPAEIKPEMCDCVNSSKTQPEWACNFRSSTHPTDCGHRVMAAQLIALSVTSSADTTSTPSAACAAIAHKHSLNSTRDGKVESFLDSSSGHEADFLPVNVRTTRHHVAWDDAARAGWRWTDENRNKFGWVACNNDGVGATTAFRVTALLGRVVVGYMGSYDPAVGCALVELFYDEENPAPAGYGGIRVDQPEAAVVLPKKKSSQGGLLHSHLIDARWEAKISAYAEYEFNDLLVLQHRALVVAVTHIDRAQCTQLQKNGDIDRGPDQVLVPDNREQRRRASLSKTRRRRARGRSLQERPEPPAARRLKQQRGPSRLRWQRPRRRPSVMR